MQAVIVFVCCFDPWWFSCMIPRGVWGIVDWNQIQHCKWVYTPNLYGGTRMYSGTFINHAFALLPLTLLYCLCIFIRLSLSCPSLTRSLPWVVAINTGCSCQCVDSSNCVFSFVLPSICQQGIELLLCYGCTQLDQRPRKSLVLQSKLDASCYFWNFFRFITYFYKSLAHTGKK